MESHARSIVKAMTWRVSALAITMGVAWFITRQVRLAATIGLVDTVIKLFAYYSHERLWMRVRFGRLHPPEYEI